MRRVLIITFAAFALFAVSVPKALAFTPSDQVKLSTVLVVCGDRKGSGVVTDGSKGYIVTAGHIAIDISTGKQTTDCSVYFPMQGSFTVLTRYDASVVHAIYDGEHDVDFAVLKLGKRTYGPAISIPVGLAFDETAKTGDPVVALGYPGSTESVQVTQGNVTGFERGMLLADTPLQEGDSGGPAVDANGYVVGISTRIRYTVDPVTGQKKVVDYDYGDVVQLMIWLDTVDPAGHDAFLRHSDYARYHSKPFFIRTQASDGCDDLARTVASPTVYCLRTGGHRAAYPDVATYRSWYGTSFSKVKYITPDNLAQYGLTGLVTQRAGSLVKIQSDPHVYLVTDDVGTLRWIPSEQMAQTYFGTDWAAKVVDVPESFFPSYTIGAPL